MIRKTLFASCLVLAAFASSAQANLVSLDASSGWKATLAPGESVTNNGYPSPSPIGSVGLTWEAANTGWNSSTSYDASAWSSYSGGWIDAYGTTPFYAREVFHIGGTVTSGTFSLQVDDDSQVWVNGTLVPGLDDHNMGTYNPYPNTADITSYLHSGDNVIAFKAHNSMGGGYSVFVLSGSVSYDAAAVPEPAMLMLFGAAFAGLVASRRGR
ncbi:MAG: PEP-CTERM sorting domain-containing protein [Rhodocyclaceae bacterium]|nr:PEP-CTERM sorting domain-containing protein [Rhodocyclaceae bacterium]